MHNNLLLAQPSDEKLYVEDVFSTWLYNGGSAQSINNGVDLSGKGGLVWLKGRSIAASNFLYDTANGGTSYLSSNTTGALANTGQTVVSFGSSGFSFPSGNVSGENSSGATYASWTFRKAPKFFDVVTYTGNGGTLDINHSLGVVPGMVFIKRTNSSSDWIVGHRGSGSYFLSSTLRLNTTAAGVTNGEFNSWTDTYVRVVNSGASYGDVNTSGASYVAYLFAHDTTADGVIQCGSYNGTGSSGNEINLGWEPQYLIVKPSSMSGSWWLLDDMRGLGLQTNSSQAESTSIGFPSLTIQATPKGFKFVDGTLNDSSQTFIYIAIRRGPMRVPTDATKVFNPVSYTGLGGSNRSVSTNNRPDTVWWVSRDGSFYSNRLAFDRLRGVSDSTSGPGGQLALNNTDAEYGNANYQINELNNASVKFGSLSYNGFDGSGLLGIIWSFTRAPSFFDSICYTGNATSRTLNHNLGVAPELMIIKSRNTNSTNWGVYRPLTSTTYAVSYLHLTNIESSRSYGPGGSPNFEELSAAPTASLINIASSAELNASGRTFVAYLFASCPGVSKIGSYTGNGTSLNIDCGFTNGARFVMIKPVSNTGHWRIWDSARGIVSGNDPFLMTSSTAAENNTTDDIDPLSSGFTVNQGGTSINVSGGTYIYLAIA